MEGRRLCPLLRSPLALVIGLVVASGLCGGDEPPVPSPLIRKLIEEGAQALRDKNYHQALRCFERAYQADPTAAGARDGLVQAHTILGIEFTNAGEMGQARECFERALRCGEDGTARFGLGYLDFLDQKDATAKDNLERSLKTVEGDSRAWKLLALLDYRRGETVSALAKIAKAVEMDPKDQEAAAFQQRWTVEGRLLRTLGESSTRHFLVRYDRSFHPEAVREILGSLEGIHTSIGQALGHWPDKQVTVLLMTEKDFYEATGSYHWVGGVYDGQIKIPVKAEDGKPGGARRTFLRTLRHEFVHVVVKELCPTCPNWLNEGIAQYFEIEGEKEPGGDQAPARAERASRRERLAKDLRALPGKRIPLEKVPLRMWEISDQAFARLTYLEGLGFVDFLVERHRAFRLRLLLAACRREGSLSRAFEVTYGAGLAGLEAQWWRSLDGPSPAGGQSR